MNSTSNLSKADCVKWGTNSILRSSGIIGSLTKKVGYFQIDGKNITIPIIVDVVYNYGKEVADLFEMNQRRANCIAIENESSSNEESWTIIRIWIGKKSKKPRAIKYITPWINIKRLYEKRYKDYNLKSSKELLHIINSDESDNILNTITNQFEGGCVAWGINSVLKISGIVFSISKTEGLVQLKEENITILLVVDVICNNSEEITDLFVMHRQKVNCIAIKDKSSVENNWKAVLVWVGDKPVDIPYAVSSKKVWQNIKELYEKRFKKYMPQETHKKNNSKNNTVNTLENLSEKVKWGRNIILRCSGIICAVAKTEGFIRLDGKEITILTIADVVYNNGKQVTDLFEIHAPIVNCIAIEDKSCTEENWKAVLVWTGVQPTNVPCAVKSKRSWKKIKRLYEKRYEEFNAEISFPMKTSECEIVMLK